MTNSRGQKAKVGNADVVRLQDRLIHFSVRIIAVGNALPNNRTGTHIALQIIRSGTSPAANYAEAQSAESRADFLHKLKICLKELRETYVWLRIIAEAMLVQPVAKLDAVIDECQQLIAIFVSCINTVRRTPGTR